MILRISLVVVVLAIAYLSLTPSDSITIGNDKISHFIAYGTLMWNIGLVSYPDRRKFMLGIILALVYGALIEVGQYFVPGRFMSGYDMVANAGGVLLGTVLTVLLYSPIMKLLKTIGIIKS